MESFSPLLVADDFCTLCELSFENRRDFTKHCENVHSLQCLLCDRKYNSQRALGQHYRDSIVHPHCECGEGFSDKLSLQAHLDIGHEEYAPLCSPDEPGHSGSAHAPLRSPGTVQPRCGSCNKAYGSEKALKQHYRDSVLHPSCQYCEEAFSDDNVLGHHIVLTHPEDPTAERSPSAVPEEHPKRTFRCDLCNRKYVSEKALVQHFRDSTRHPTCEHCDASFPDLRTRQAHVVEVHKTRPGMQDTPRTPGIGVDARPLTYHDLRTTQEMLSALFMNGPGISDTERPLCSACHNACTTAVLCVTQHILCEKCVSGATAACPSCRSNLLPLFMTPR